MSTILNTNGDTLAIPEIASPEDFTCSVIYAEWNEDVTGALRDGAVATLEAAGALPGNVRIIKVPGTVELTYAAAREIRLRKPSAVIVLGCVIRGDTAHFDYVCQSVTQGVAAINATAQAPVIFGVLTVDNLQQALDRAGGCLGNKGSEAAAAAITMAQLPD